MPYTSGSLFMSQKAPSAGRTKGTGPVFAAADVFVVAAFFVAADVCVAAFVFDGLFLTGMAGLLIEGFGEHVGGGAVLFNEMGHELRALQRADHIADGQSDGVVVAEVAVRAQVSSP